MLDLAALYFQLLVVLLIYWHCPASATPVIGQRTFICQLTYSKKLGGMRFLLARFLPFWQVTDFGVFCQSDYRVLLSCDLSGLASTIAALLQKMNMQIEYDWLRFFNSISSSLRIDYFTTRSV